MILHSPKDLNYIPKRIISLVPSQTELLHYLWLEEETIAITKFCIQPEEWFNNKPWIGGTKSLNIEKIRSLQPDLIIANNEENLKEEVEELAVDFPVWVTDVRNLETSLKMIGDIGQLTGKESEANNLQLKIKIEFAYLEEAIGEYKQAPLRAAYFIWKDPCMTVGADTFIHDMMKRSGFQNIFDAKLRYPEVELGQLKALDCEILLLSSEPYPFASKHIAAFQESLPGIKILLVDGEMFSWYGSRLLHAPAYFKTLRQQILNSKV